MKRLTTALCALALFAAPALAEKSSFDLSLPLSLLSGADGRITLTCNDTDDRDTLAMMRSLDRRSRSSWTSRDDDSRVAASRQGSKFRLRAWSDGDKTLDLRMPWAVAECLFGGRPGQTIEFEADSIKAQGGFHMLLGGETASFGLSVNR